MKEWGNFQQQAIQLIRKGSVPNEVGVMRLFQILILPSFTPSVGWEICRKVSRSGETKFFAVHSCWQIEEDFKKFETPVDRLQYPRELSPTIETISFEITGEIVESFFDKLKSIAIPTYTNTGIFGCDGTHFEFSFGHSFLSAKYAWWEDPPSEWKQLGDAVLDFLEKLSDDRQS